MFDTCLPRSVLIAITVFICSQQLSESHGGEAATQENDGNVETEVSPEGQQRSPQYEHDGIVIPGAWADEPRRDALSIEKAVAYVEDGAAAWNGANNCVACHTTGAYLCMRPLLTDSLGQPSEEIRTLFVADLKELEEEADLDPEKVQHGIVPAHVANLAWGLAEWDAHVRGSLSDETKRALALLFRVQSEDGSFSNEQCWPPFESCAYQATVVAAMAVATAPGWMGSNHDDATRASVDRLKNYLQVTAPPHAYAEVLLLRAALRWPELMNNDRRRRLYTDMFTRRNADGGWAMRDFATPEQWGDSSRAEKLRDEPEFASPPSDAHMTALVLIAYLEAGMARDDMLIRRGIDWLKSNQRESGRWWTRSLNTDDRHLITYSGSLYALVALNMSGSLNTLR